jgi:hypothetical protein
VLETQRVEEIVVGEKAISGLSCCQFSALIGRDVAVMLLSTFTLVGQ